MLGALVPDAGTAVQTVVVAAANVLSTAARFVAMRRWIFRAPADVAPASRPRAALSGPTDRHDPAYAIDGVLESPHDDR